MTHTMTNNTLESHNYIDAGMGIESLLRRYDRNEHSTVSVYNVGGTAEVAELLECPKQQVHSLRKNPKFPTPVRELAATPLWSLSEVATFKASWKRRGSRKQSPKVDFTV